MTPAGASTSLTSRINGMTTHTHSRPTREKTVIVQIYSEKESDDLAGNKKKEHTTTKKDADSCYYKVLLGINR